MRLGLHRFMCSEIVQWLGILTNMRECVKPKAFLNLKGNKNVVASPAVWRARIKGNLSVLLARFFHV